MRADTHDGPEQMLHVRGLIHCCSSHVRRSWNSVLQRTAGPYILARLGHADSHQICPVLKVDRPCHRATACQSRLCDVDFPRKLMDLLSYKAISSVPKLANRTPFAFVVDSFLVRAADYSVGHRDR